MFCHELLNSAVYTFLDDAPLEERRTRAVYTRRATEPRSADDLGALDPAAIERVRDEAGRSRDTPTSCTMHCCWRASSARGEAAPAGAALFDALVAPGRAFDADGFWVAVERFDEFAR